MRKVILPRHFIFSVLLLLVLVSVYIFSEAGRLQGELLRQAEAKGVALADTMESNIRSAILGNALLEDLISQRLLDNARLVDQLLQFPPVDRTFLEKVATLNGLRKIDLLDFKGQPLPADLPAAPRRPMHEMMARMQRLSPDAAAEQHRAMMTFMWGRRWRLPQDEAQPTLEVAEQKFWEGSVFGVAIGAKSFPGIIAVHADADYILNFRKEIDVQKQIEELGRQSDIAHIALVDKEYKFLAHTTPQLVNQRQNEPLLRQMRSDSKLGRRVVKQANGQRHYEVVKAVSVNGSPVGFLEIGLSLSSMEAAWQRSVRSMVVFGLGILAVGILGMGAIFYNQQTHLQKVKSLEVEINRSERLAELGNLAATVAHEIRNPLNSVSMGLQRLKSEFTPGQEQEKNEYTHFLNIMQSEVSRLNAIVEQFLSLSRPLTLKPEAIPLEEFLKELTTLAAEDAKSSGVEIDLRVAPHLPPLPADRDYLKQLLLNLILNGVQAMPVGGMLTLEAGADKNNFQITVADCGTGIDPETLKRIFEPYFTTKPNGSGLGLPIARRIAEAHGGTITVESDRHRGSRFRVMLPRGVTEA
ncbi:MAG: ATP-binding protein [Deltaproteobacteria bacterium]|nr:ATP-binding protein [Deltaproteobacteria bacterium]